MMRPASDSLTMPPMTDRRKIAGEPPKSILIVLPTWVGDFVMATPLLRAVRTRFPEARITLLAEPNLRGLIEGGAWMDEVVEWPAKNRRQPWHREHRQMVSQLRAKRIDWAVLLPNSARSALVAYLAGSKRRIGYNRDGRGLLLTDKLACKNLRNGMNSLRLQENNIDDGLIDDRSSARADTRGSSGRGTHRPLVRWGERLPVKLGPYEPYPMADYYADLCEFMGCGRSSQQYELFTTPDCDQSINARLQRLGIADRRPLVVLSPGAKFGAAKCWPASRFAETSDRLIREHRAAVVITCGPGEEVIAQSIGESMQEQGFVFDDPGLSLGQLKSLIKRSHLLICNDAGPRHFAKAFGVNLVTIFGPTHPEWTATDYPNEYVMREDIECGPCQQRVCPLGHLKCMDRVSVDAVCAAAVALLSKSTVAAANESSHD